MAYTDNISRLSRLTAILLKLQSRPYIKVPELAEEFQVSTRTIYRDLDSLTQAGVPLVADEQQGYALVQGYHLPPVMFTEAEANALMIAEKLVAKSKDLSLIQDFQGAVDKIRAVLDETDKEKARFLAERTVIGKNWENEITSEYLSDIQQALTEYRLLEISYQKNEPTLPSQRLIEPFAIYQNTAENWVLIAWCRLRKDFRSFRIDRIVKLRSLDETFSPHTITLEEYVAQQRKKHVEDPLT